MARLCAAGVSLRDQVNERFPKRDKASDGWIGDSAHAARASDHNPDSKGVVHAIDIDEDFGAPGDSMKLANQLVSLARDGKDGGRLKYVVYEDKIASGTYSDTFWQWRGSGYGHDKHIHVSFTNRADNDGHKFNLSIFDPAPAGEWDGVVPEYDAIVASMDRNFPHASSWRLACRLKDMGFFHGLVAPKGTQMYPRIAVGNWQESIGSKPTGRYGPIAHERIFDI